MICFGFGDQNCSTKVRIASDKSKTSPAIERVVAEASDPPVHTSAVGEIRRRLLVLGVVGGTWGLDIAALLSTGKDDDRSQFKSTHFLIGNDMPWLDPTEESSFGVVNLCPSLDERAGRRSELTLPSFKYHPEPLATGVVRESSNECVCCGQSRGYIYTGPVYAIEEYDESICPWCIADGSAHEKLDVSFTDEAGIGGYGDWEAVPENVIAEVVSRTPGFSGWQQEQWWTHCGDAAQFIGRAGHAELEAFGPEAVAAIRASTGLEDGPEWAQFFRALSKDGSPTSYVFRCTRCGALGGYQDCN